MMDNVVLLKGDQGKRKGVEKKLTRGRDGKR